MDEQASQGKAVVAVFGRWWVSGLLAAFAASFVLDFWNRATELRPDHSDILAYCFGVAGVMAILSAAIGFRSSKGPIFSRTLAALFGFGLIGGLSTVFLTMSIAEIIENWLDFPPARTRTYWALLPIDRAHRFDSKGGSHWTIRPVPFWTDIDISHSDYQHMLARLYQADGRSEPKTIDSGGVFCARVQMQQAGEALRVLHAGRYKLPDGTIGVCSEMHRAEPALTIM